VNKQPIRGSTNFLDAEGKTTSTYELKVLGDGGEERKSGTVRVWDSNSLSIPLQKPADGVTESGAYTYCANDATVGDLDGDGQYEIVMKWDPNNSQDNSKSGFTGNTYVDAYKLDGTHLWRIDLGRNIRAGAHYTHVMVYDLDGDGKDEIFTGPAAIDDDGTGLWSSGLDHGDAMHLGDFNPDRLGLELFPVQENTAVPYSNDMKDAKTGRVLWGLPQIGIDVGRGLTADIDPRYKGAESWSVGGGWNSQTGTMFNAQGQIISEQIPSTNFAIWWDGDLSRELLDHEWLGDSLRVGIPKIDKWNYETQQMENVVTFRGTYSNNDTKGNPSQGRIPGTTNRRIQATI
jgi:hypothetical protein